MHRIVLLIALVLVATPSVAQEAWMDEIEVGEWTPFSGETDRLTLVMDAVSPPNSSYERLWLRLEFRIRNQPDGDLSNRLLMEIDCVEWRTPFLAADTFAENNLEGNIIASDSSTQEWTYAAPSTGGDALAKHFCQ